MPITVTRQRDFLNDADGDNVADPGDTFTHIITVINGEATAATNLFITESENGISIDAGSFNIGPIAIDDNLNTLEGTINGNTPVTFTSAQLLANDIDPDDLTPNLTITKIGTTDVVDINGDPIVVNDIPVTNGTVTSNGDGTFTFTPTTGFEGAASFTYSTEDEDGVESVAATPGLVSITVSDPVWYIDSLNGSDVTGDGTFDNPFATMAPISTGGTFDTGVTGDDDNDIIFIYDRGGTYTTSIVLEAGQQLYGDSFGLMVNGLSIGASTNNTSIQYSGVGVTLSTNNTINGLNLTGTANGAIGIEDGGGSVSTGGGELTIDNTSIMGSGKAVDIDQGGDLQVTLDTLSSQNSTTQGVQLAGTASSGDAGLLTGTFTATAGTIQTASSHNFQIGSGAASSGGRVAVDYDGALTNSASGSAVNISGRLSSAGDIRFDGAISQDSGATTASDGIAISDVASGNIFFTGTKTIDMIGSGDNAVSVTANGGAVVNFSGGAFDIDTDSGHGFAISQTGGQVNVSVAADVDTTTGRGISITGSTGGATNFTGGALTISTTSGDALHSNNAASGSSLTVTGSGNTLSTSAGGQLVDISNTGTSAITFDTMSQTGATAVADDAIFVNNLDGGTWTTNTITVTGTTGAGSDGIVIQGGSSTNFSLGTVNLGTNTSAISDDGIELNGVGGNPVGTVTATSVNIQNTGGQGVEINTYNNTVNLNGGGIGNVNDSAAEGVLITGNGGDVNIAASITKNTSSGSVAGNVVEVQNHASGTITFSGAISATGSIDDGILINNSGGTIAFTNASKTLTTGNNTAVQLTSNSANVDFTGGGLLINTTAGTGISAGTIATATGGTLTVSGTGNTITSTTGSAFVLNGTDSDGITFQSINKTGGTATAIYIKDAGTGGFTITGTNSDANSGGTISSVGDGGTNFVGTVGTGVYIENTSNIVLEDMRFGNGTTMENFSIYGLNVVNFTLRDSVINGQSGDIAGGTLESGIFFDKLTGVGLFEGNNISGGFIDNMRIDNDAATGTLNLFVRDNATSGDQAVFGLNHSGNDAADSLNVQVYGDGNVLALIDGVQFTGYRGDGIQISAFDTANTEVTIRNNAFSNNHSNISSGGGIGILVGGTAGGGTWGVDYTIQNNTVTGSVGPAIAASFNGFGGTARGFISGNTVGTPGNGVSDNSGSTQGSGIFVATVRSGAAGTLTQFVTITGNTLRDITHSGINVRASNGPTAGNNAITEATITNNTISQMNGPPGNHAALYALAGGAATDNSILRMEINNNTFNINGTFQAYAPIYFDQIFGTAAQYQFPSYVGTDGENNDIITYLTARTNTFTTDADQLDPGSAVYSPDAIMNAGALATAQDGTNTQLPTGAMQLDPADEEPVEEPAPSDPTPPTDEGGDPGDGGDGDGDDGDTGDGDTGAGDGGGDPAPEPEPGHPVIVDDNSLTQAELDYLVEAAIERWAAAGASAEQLAAMRATHFSISEMMGTYLGTSTPGSVYVDSDGAGHGWFLDHTPGEDGEFDAAGGVLKADADGAAAGKMDLLTVLMHELGHQVGLDDLYNVNNAAELMYGYARLAERRLPQADDLAGADMSHAGHESFIESSPTVASLPAGKGVNIVYTSTVVGNPNGIIGTPFVNTSTVETDNFANVVSTDENLVVDTLTLGDTVYVDANNNNQFDSGEGWAGVTVTLYADTDASGGYSAGDLAVAGGTDTTDANGNYGWSNLDAGNYIVVVDAANFGSGGVLEGYLTAPGTADPDDNEDDDDNGVDGLGGVVASKTITLAFNTETSAGVGNDTNNTLDFGFLDPNDAPVITSPATASGNEDTVIAVTGISIVDVDAGTSDVLVTLSIAGGALDLGTTTGLTVIGEGTNLVTLEGTLTDLNSSLATLTYTPVADFNANPINLSITANDQGATGPDPGLTGDANSEEDTATVAITVNAVVDIADDTVNLAEDAGATDLTGANDPLGNDSFENSGRAITAVSDPTNGTAVIDDNDTPLDATDDFIVYTPDADYAGADSFTYTVTSGGVTEQATINVNLSAVNDAPTGADDTITAVEDTFRPLSATDFGFDDVDVGDMLSEVIITGVTGVTLYIDTGADGFDDPGDAVSSFPVTVTAAQLLANQVAIKAAPNASGAGLGEITFNVVDDSGAGNDTSVAENTLTVDVTAVNDAPTLQLSDVGPSATLDYDEGDLASAMAPTAILDDIDSPNFGGGSLTVSFAANGTSADQLGILAADGITTSGTDVLFNSVDIGDFSGGANGANLVINFDSDASVTAVEALIHAISYSNNSDDPSEMSRTVNYLVDDGDGGTSTASANATVNVNAINDGPVNTPGGIVNIAEDSGATTLSGMSIADPDSGADDIIVGFSVEHGTLAINTGVVGGITAGDIQFQDANTIVVVATRAEINATLADAAGLTYTPDAHYHGNDTLEIATNDNGQNGDDPGLTGDPNNEQDLDTRQISISAVNDQVSSTVTSPINVNEDTAGALTLSISDIDTTLSPNGIYQVTLTATNGTTTLTTLTGLTFSAGDGDGDAVMTFRGTLDDINTALGTASFTGSSNFNGGASVQIDVTDDVLGTVATGSGTGTSDSDTISITVDPVDDDPTATDDAFITNEATDITAQNLLTNEADPDGGAAPTIAEVNNESLNVGSEITLDSGAKLTVNSDGTFHYKPNGAFDDLAEFGSGASNTLDSDSFTYTLTTGGTATVTLTIQGDYSDPHLMLGTAGDDNITGTFFDDIFSPGTGADTMTGHQGDDIYEVDDTGDETIEAFGEGNDEVRSTINWTLHKHLDDLTLLGAATHGTGNQLANTIVGNANNNVLDGLGGADTMRGGAGDDLYFVQSPNDQAVETSLANGHDTVVSSANQFTLGAFVENLILVGNAVRGEGNGLANLIIGNARGNVLDGKGGADEMRGGAGDDLYHVDNANDVIVELNGGGSDTARATVDYTIGYGVNHLELAGTAIIGTGNNGGNHITGNGLNNLLKGLEGNDRLTGGNGDDKLVGGLGNDRLQGDAGADTFYFTTELNPATNVDEILDFSVADDTIRLNTDVFDAIANGTLSVAAFHTGATATTAAHRIIYNSATGSLYYDEDGNGAAHDQILFATLDTGLALTNADFVGF